MLTALVQAHYDCAATFWYCGSKKWVKSWRQCAVYRSQCFPHFSCLYWLWTVNLSWFMITRRFWILRNILWKLTFRNQHTQCEICSCIQRSLSGMSQIICASSLLAFPGESAGEVKGNVQELQFDSKHPGAVEILPFLLPRSGSVVVAFCYLVPAKFIFSFWCWYDIFHCGCRSFSDLLWH